jgi:hypothetical protein
MHQQFMFFRSFSLKNVVFHLVTALLKMIMLIKIITPLLFAVKINIKSCSHEVAKHKSGVICQFHLTLPPLATTLRKMVAQSVRMGNAHAGSLRTYDWREVPDIIHACYIQKYIFLQKWN